MNQEQNILLKRYHNYDNIKPNQDFDNELMKIQKSHYHIELIETKLL